MSQCSSLKKGFVLSIISLFVGLALFFAPSPALAAGGEDYTYTIRIFAGNQGSFNNGEPVKVITAQPGSWVTFYTTDVQLNNDSKYYVRGLRESGRDNDTSLAMPAFTVTEDIDFVVAYGIRGQDVEYTVRYVDANGNELAPSETFWGNVGDSPVLAYRYIEGYIPQAYNLTGELYEDPANNVFEFVYTALGEEAEQQAPEGDETAGVTPPGAAGAAGELIDDEGNPLATPEDVIDIRDDENPLAGPFGDLTDGAQILRNAWALIIGSLALAAIAIAFIVLTIKRRKKEMANGLQH